jgi:hypothetical protein
MTAPARRPDPATVGGWSVTVRAGRVFLVDQAPDRDPGMSAREALALAEALVAAALEAKRDRGAER